jgi:hypothetical protein
VLGEFLEGLDQRLGAGDGDSDPDTELVVVLAKSFEGFKRRNA